MPTINSNRVAIELHVPDLEKAKPFYKKLGFKVVSGAPMGRNPGYLVLRLKDSFLNFYGWDKRVYEHSSFANFPKNTRRGGGYEIEITIILDSIKKYYKSVYPKIKGNIVQPLTLKRWCRSDFRIADPFGFYIRFTEPVP